MLEFIKMFGMGILYTILSPLIVAVFLLFVIYSFFNYLVLEVINFFGFFMGKRFSVETKLQKQMKKDIENRKAQINTMSIQPQPVIQPQSPIINNNSKDGDLNA